MSHNNQKQLNFLNQLSELLVTQDSDEFIQSIPQLLCDYLEADACVIWKLNSKDQKFTIIASSSKVDSEYQSLELRLKHPAVESFIQRNYISCINNINQYCSVSRSRLFAQKEIEKRKWVSLVSCTIREPNHHNHIVGIIDVFCKCQCDFDESTKFLISHISNLIIIASQKNEQNSLKKLTQIIYEMTRISNEIEIWELLYNSAPDLVDAEHWLVGKIEYSQGKIDIIKKGSGFKYPRNFGWRTGLIGLALREEKTINAYNIRDSKWKGIYQEGWSDTKSEIAIPIKVDTIPIRKGTEIESGTKLFGILNIESTKIAHFSQKDQNHLELLVRFAAIMLDRIEFETKLKLLRKVEKKLLKLKIMMKRLILS
ncbi:GAF domain-containing protein [Desertifilum tharense IPPAS B-1220]|uniref:GAF domain-containing protein n=1 Tax=Desertifilum tharense TaxID=1185873 RepID=UPI003ED185D6